MAVPLVLPAFCEKSLLAFNFKLIAVIRQLGDREDLSIDGLVYKHSLDDAPDVLALLVELLSSL